MFFFIQKFIKKFLLSTISEYRKSSNKNNKAPNSNPRGVIQITYGIWYLE